MTLPDWQQPTSAEYFRPREHIGELLDITFTRYLAAYATAMTKPGDEGAAEADVLILDGPMAGTRYLGQEFPQQGLRATLRVLSPGQHLLTRISKAPDANGRSGAFSFAPYTDADLELARAFYAQQAIGNLPPAVAQAAVYPVPVPAATVAPGAAPLDEQAAFRAWQAAQAAGGGPGAVPAANGAQQAAQPQGSYVPPTYGGVPAAAGAGPDDPPF